MGWRTQAALDTCAHGCGATEHALTGWGRHCWSWEPRQSAPSAPMGSLPRPPSCLRACPRPPPPQLAQLLRLPRLELEPPFKRYACRVQGGGMSVHEIRL